MPLIVHCLVVVQHKGQQSFTLPTTTTRLGGYTASTDIVYIVNGALIITIPLWSALVLLGGKRDWNTWCFIFRLLQVTSQMTWQYLGLCVTTCEHLIPQLSALRMEKKEYHYRLVLVVEAHRTYILWQLHGINFYTIITLS